MKKILASFLGMAFLTAALTAVAGWHFGEFKNLQVDIEYFDYAYKLGNGEPVYYIGSTMRYHVKLRNLSRRTYNNFQSQSSLVWVGNYSCQRWWYDRTSASFAHGTLLPGDSKSGLRPVSMKKIGAAEYEVTYKIPLSICPGRGEVVVEGRHKNDSGREEVASFKIPVGYQLRRKD